MTVPLVWYRDGLKFGCTQCGNCCSGHGVVWVDMDEIEELARGLQLPRAEFARRYVRHIDGRYSLIDKGTHGDCVFLGDDRRCSLYEHRPRQCRTWPFWESNLTSRKAWTGAGTRCPGIDKGTHYPLEEIERIGGINGDLADVL